MKVTSSFLQINEMRHPNKVVQGSQGAGKTFSILQRWVLLALAPDADKELVTITSSTYPSLRTGAIRDLHTILDNEGIDYNFIKSPTYLVYVGAWVFEFQVFEDEKKARGPRRDRLFINEADRLPWQIARHLIARTRKEKVFDFNPVSKFWAHNQFVDVNDCDFVKLTYKDNEELPQAEVDSIESHAPWGKTPDENYWRVFGLGEIGFLVGQILTYKSYDHLPEGVDLQIAYGIDLGDVDPMSAVRVAVDHKNKRLYWEEKFYASNADNEPEMIKAVLGKETADGFIKEYDGERVLCEHDPRFIRAARKEGLNAVNASKKTIKGRVKSIKQYQLFIHKDSENLIREADNWVYQVKPDGSIIDYPDQKCEDHAIDAASYGSVFVIMD